MWLQMTVGDPLGDGLLYHDLGGAFWNLHTRYNGTEVITHPNEYTERRGNLNNTCGLYRRQLPACVIVTIILQNVTMEEDLVKSIYYFPFDYKMIL